jgi:hypothetical protein
MTRFLSRTLRYVQGITSSHLLSDTLHVPLVPLSNFVCILNTLYVLNEQRLVWNIQTGPLEQHGNFESKLTVLCIRKESFLTRRHF